jgi:hypothetical protein
MTLQRTQNVHVLRTQPRGRTSQPALHAGAHGMTLDAFDNAPVGWAPVPTRYARNRVGGQAAHPTRQLRGNGKPTTLERTA